MPKKYLKDFYWKDYVTIIFGVALYSVGLIGFIKPSGIVTGGLNGIGLLLDYATGGSISLLSVIFVVNSILLIAALLTLGFNFLRKTIFGVISMTACIALAEKYVPTGIIVGEPMLSGMLGGIMCGAGLGIVFSVNGSTGGTDIIIAIINKFKNYSFGRVMMVLDLLVICSAFLLPEKYFLEKKGLVSITQEQLIELKMNMIITGVIVMFVMTYTIDFAINGFRQSVQFLIFSEKYETIADVINKELNRGCTVLDGTGWYSKRPVKVIVLLAKQNESVNVFRMIKSIDENAFISQSNVRGVYGKGFDAIKH